MNEQLLKIKEDQKALARKIRNGKRGRKPKFRDEEDPDWTNLNYNKYDYRHKHIAYCTIRGRSRQDIERPREGNLPHEGYIKTLIEKYNEAIRISETRLTA